MTDHQPPPTGSAEHLRGPWLAVLADNYGFVYSSVADARENADDPDSDEFEVSVRRGDALPTTPIGDRPRLPGSYSVGDLAYQIDDVYLDDPDGSVSATARFAQAQAMADGLNAAGGAQ